MVAPTERGQLMKKLTTAFISYSTDANTKAKQVVGYLKPLQVDTYEFSEDMGFGGDVAKQVEDAIKVREALVMVLSAASRESPWVAAEYGIAKGYGKRIIVHKSAHNLDLPSYFSKSVYVLSRLEDLDQHFG